VGNIFFKRETINMGTIVLLLIVVAVIAVLAALKAKSQGGGADEVWPFVAKKPLSQPEQVLYFRLIQALPEHIVLAQVQLSRLLGIKKGNNYQAWLNRINRMSVDFVVCNKDSSIVAVIELDDATHRKDDRQAADAKKDKALTSAGVRIVRWQAKSIPDVATIQSTIMPKIAVKSDPPQSARRLP
jgi:very-short-patch-repair endonuclease